MKYLKEFETEQEYTSYMESDSLILPNISLINNPSNGGEVSLKFNPYIPSEESTTTTPVPEESTTTPVPDESTTTTPKPSYNNYNGHEYVDLGLPSGTHWAKYNVGSNSESDYGLYFAWGETVGYKDASSGKSFSPDDYKFENGDACDGKFTKYDSSDNLTTLLLEDDAASVNMGGSWHMPSKEQYEELINPSYTTTTWTTRNGINGRLITSRTNGNTLFLPASGDCNWGSVGDVGSYGWYWSSSLCEGSPDSAWYLDFNSGDINVYYDFRYFGRTVRGVVG